MIVIIRAIFPSPCRLNKLYNSRNCFSDVTFCTKAKISSPSSPIPSLCILPHELANQQKSLPNAPLRDSLLEWKNEKPMPFGMGFDILFDTGFDKVFGIDYFLIINIITDIMISWQNQNVNSALAAKNLLTVPPFEYKFI